MPKQPTKEEVLAVFIASNYYETDSLVQQVIALWEPTTEEMLADLGDRAVVGHPTDPDWYPYTKLNEVWYCSTGTSVSSETDANVADMIKRYGFEVVYEGIK